MFPGRIVLQTTMGVLTIFPLVLFLYISVTSVVCHFGVTHQEAHKIATATCPFLKRTPCASFGRMICWVDIIIGQHIISSQKNKLQPTDYHILPYNNHRNHRNNNLQFDTQCTATLRSPVAILHYSTSLFRSFPRKS